MATCISLHYSWTTRALFVPPSVTGMHDATQQTQPTVQSFDEKFECIKYRFDTSSTFPDVHAYRTFENPTNPFTYFSPRRTVSSLSALQYLTLFEMSHLQSKHFHPEPRLPKNSSRPDSNPTRPIQLLPAYQPAVPSITERQKQHHRSNPKHDQRHSPCIIPAEYPWPHPRLGRHLCDRRTTELSGILTVAREPSLSHRDGISFEHDDFSTHHEGVGGALDGGTMVSITESQQPRSSLRRQHHHGEGEVPARRRVGPRGLLSRQQRDVEDLCRRGRLLGHHVRWMVGCPHDAGSIFTRMQQLHSHGNLPVSRLHQLGGCPVDSSMEESAQRTSQLRGLPREPAPRE